MRRPAVSLALAGTCLLGLIATAFLALAVEAVGARDAAILYGFMALDQPRLEAVFDAIAHAVDPLPYAAAGLVLTGIALARGRRWRAVTVAALLVVTGVTTQVAKQLLAEPRFDPLLANQIGEASWPSGHATAAMTLALCAVLVAPPRLRPVVAVVGGGFALAVGYSLLVLLWHYPSDVLGGYLVAGLWTSLGLAGLSVLERSAPATVARPRIARAGLALTAAVGAGVAGAALTRDGFFEAYALERPTLVVGAVVIALLAVALPTALARAA